MATIKRSFGHNHLKPATANCYMRKPKKLKKLYVQIKRITDDTSFGKLQGARKDLDLICHWSARKMKHGSRLRWPDKFIGNPGYPKLPPITIVSLKVEMKDLKVMGTFTEGK